MSKVKKKALVDMSYVDFMKMDLRGQLSCICKLSHKHEVQHWLDEEGTDDQKLAAILRVARIALGTLDVSS